MRRYEPIGFWKHEPKMKLDLGGGRMTVENFINIDLYVGKSEDQEDTTVNVVADLNCGLPFKDCSVIEIHAHHVLEHIREIKELMNDCWRILYYTGLMKIWVPKWPDPDAFVDPTHVRYFLPETFGYWSVHNQYCYMYQFRPWVAQKIDVTEKEIYVELRPIKCEWREV